MSCQVSLEDLEDLNKKYDNSFDNVKKHIEKYKEIVINLYDFYKKNHKKRYFKKKFGNYFGRVGRRSDIVVKKAYIIYTYNYMVNNKELTIDDEFMHYIQIKSARNISGVNAFAILLAPYPDNNEGFNGCLHDCFYCPNETKANGAQNNISRSYLSKEPAVARGLRQGWDPILQINDRLNSLLVQGLQIDKLELIIEGGTYTEYPIDYLTLFHRDIFYAANTFFNKEKREKLSMDEEIIINQTGSVKVIGICVETRPDTLDEKWVRFFRKSGTTRIQLGVQHSDNKILKKINRGHTFEKSCDAIKILKDNCFKIDIHIMPDLPGSTPEMDIKMFDIILNSPVISPDQIKIYPTEIVPWTKIKKWHDEGTYEPYADKSPRSLVDVVKHAVKITPYHTRISRIVRDIPLTYISGGNVCCNLRQIIQDELEKENFHTKDIRQREIGRNPHYRFKLSRYFVTRYYGSGSIEYFISLESLDRKALFGFIRLRIPPKDHKPYFNTLLNKGLIRELHVYNWIVPVNKKSMKGACQHKGVGKTLLKIAECVAWLHNLEGVAVITGEGVRTYYNKRGYYNSESFAVKKFTITKNEWMLCVFVILIFKIVFTKYNC